MWVGLEFNRSWMEPLGSRLKTHWITAWGNKSWDSCTKQVASVQSTNSANLSLDAHLTRKKQNLDGLSAPPEMPGETVSPRHWYIDPRISRGEQKIHCMRSEAFWKVLWIAFLWSVLGCKDWDFSNVAFFETMNQWNQALWLHPTGFPRPSDSARTRRCRGRIFKNILSAFVVSTPTYSYNTITNVEPCDTVSWVICCAIGCPSVVSNVCFWEWCLL